MKILTLPSHLLLALELMRRLGARSAPTTKRAPPRAAKRARRVAVRSVPALPAALHCDDELRLVAHTPRRAPAPRLGRAWAVRAGTGHRAIGLPRAPGLWL